MTTQEALPLPDQVDEAINYIKSLEAKVKMAQEKKENLQGIRKRSRGCFSNNSANFAATSGFPKSPQLEIHEVGSSLQVVLTCGLDHQFIFYEIIQILHEENIDVRSANSSLAGDSMLHVVHAEVCIMLLFNFPFILIHVSNLTEQEKYRAVRSSY